MPGAPLLDEEFLTKIERLTLAARSAIQGKVRGERRSKRRGFSTEFADYRDYVPGDDLRYLDWNIYGRLERLFVKLFHEEEDLTVSILVDVSASMAEGDPPKLRYALQIAAALAYIALSAEDRVGVYPFDGALRAPFAPVRGRRNTPRLFRYLEAQEPGKRTDIEKSLHAYALGHARRGIAILISDLLDPAGYERALRHLRGGRAEPYLIHLLSPQELEPALAGDLRLVDCEDQSAAEVSIHRGLLAVYRETVRAFREEVRSQCARRGILPIFAASDLPFEQLVLGYLRTRGLLR